MPAICKVKSCETVARYKKEGAMYPTHCRKHASDKMVCHRAKQCKGNDCAVKPVFGKPGTQSGIFCDDCRPPDYKNVLDKECANCSTRASFMFNKELYCGTHAPTGSELYGYKKCCVEGCKGRAAFNFPKGDPIDQVCTEHKLEGMKTCKSPFCITDGCSTLANYNLPGITPPIHCFEHKEDKMVSVTAKLCRETDCPYQPYFSTKGKKVGEYCLKHKGDNMVDVRHKMCEECGEKRAIYKDDQDIVRFCIKDGKRLFPPKKGEIRVVNGSKTCDECDKQCNFGFKGETAIKCGIHREPGMINVKTKRCFKEGCDRPVSQGYRFTTPTSCKFHRKPGMVPRARINEKCTKEGCKAVATFCKGDDPNPTRCEVHKTKIYVEMVNKTCTACSSEVPMSDSGHLCEDCIEVTKPRGPRKGKEHRVREILELNDIEITSHDLSVEGGCSTRRPDFIIDCDIFFLIVEVDENQHGNRDCQCEIGRMVQLHQDFGGTPLIFIRYNPDKYQNHNGTMISGTRENPLREKRLVSLIKRIRKTVTVDNVPALSAFFLYYDGDDGKDTWYVLDYFEHSVTELNDLINDRSDKIDGKTDEE